MLIYDYIFARDPGILGKLLDKKNHEKAYYKWRDGLKKQFLAAQHEERTMEFVYPDGRKCNVKGFYYPCRRTPSRKVALIIHGYRSDHAETAGVFYDYYKKHGIDIFCPDNPAAGESEGKYIGFDYFESEAALQWINTLKNHYGRDIKIILHGFSMGGGAVIRMSDMCPDNVKFIVDDCGFTGAPAMLRDKLGILYKPVKFLNKKIAGYDLDKTDVRPHLRRTKIPILFVHGLNDPTVPARMGQELYENCPSEKDCLFTENAKHMESWYRNREEYEEKLNAYIKKYM